MGSDAFIVLMPLDVVVAVAAVAGWLRGDEVRP
jgi:hypothetical protein